VSHRDIRDADIQGNVCAARVIRPSGLFPSTPRVAHTSSLMYAPHRRAQHLCHRVPSMACPAPLTVADTKGDVGATRAWATGTSTSSRLRRIGLSRTHRHRRRSGQTPHLSRTRQLRPCKRARLGTLRADFTAPCIPASPVGRRCAFAALPGVFSTGTPPLGGVRTRTMSDASVTWMWACRSCDLEFGNGPKARLGRKTKSAGFGLRTRS
jgi:hypothetical protein